MNAPDLAGLARYLEPLAEFVATAEPHRRALSSEMLRDVADAALARDLISVHESGDWESDLLGDWPAARELITRAINRLADEDVPDVVRSNPQADPMDPRREYVSGSALDKAHRRGEL